MYHEEKCTTNPDIRDSCNVRNRNDRFYIQNTSEKTSNTHLPEANCCEYDDGINAIFITGENNNQTTSDDTTQEVKSEKSKSPEPATPMDTNSTTDEAAEIASN